MKRPSSILSVVAEWHPRRSRGFHFIRDWAEKTGLAIDQLLQWVGLRVGKFYQWRQRYGMANQHNGSVPRDFWLQDWERKAVLDFQQLYPSEGYLDKELILGITFSLEQLGYAVYVDWKTDTHLSRDKVDKATAEIVRGRITQSTSLFFATTEGAKDSRWMPWELGYMDGKKNKSAILPVSQDGSGNTYKGQEYLGIYPYITRDTDTHQKERLWVHENAEKYVVFEAWLNGKQPCVHD